MVVSNYILIFFSFINAIFADSKNDPPEYEGIPELEMKMTCSNAKAAIGEVVTFEITADVPMDYYVYSTNIECEIGPLPPVISVSDDKSLALIGNPISIKDSIYHDDIFDCKVGAFKKKVIIRQQAKLLKKVETDIKCEVQMCSNVSGLCIPFAEQFQIYWAD